VLASAAVAALGCGDGPGIDPVGSVVEADSLGIRIVTHAGPSSVDSVALDPMLRIGREGEPDYEFFRLRTVAPLASGNIVAANGGTSELLFYSPDGTFLRRAGRPGEGPAEFGFLTTLYLLPGDTLVVSDPRRRRLVLFDSAGVFVRGESFAQDLTTAPPSGGCFFPGLMGVLANGTRLMSGWGCMDLKGSEGVRPTLMTIELVNGSTRDTLGHFNINSVWEHDGSASGPAPYFLIPFQPRMAWVAAWDRVHLSEGEVFEVRTFDDSGHLMTIMREAAVPAMVTEEDRRAYLMDIEADGRSHPDGAPFAEYFGAYTRFVVAHDGSLWARWSGPSNEELTRWSVFSADGSELRHVFLPSIDLAAVRDGRAYGYVEDDVGIQSVVVLSLPR
jgi:hypothetical protein